MKTITQSILEAYNNQFSSFEQLFHSSRQHAVCIEGTSQGAQHIFAKASLEKIGYVNIADIYIINGSAKNISVDDVRAMKKHLYRTPGSMHNTVGLILSADSMTTQAANALLKILEEPPKHVKLILTATDLASIPQTVISRCAQLFLPALTQKQIAQIAHTAVEHPNPNAFSLYEANIELLSDSSAANPLQDFDEVLSFAEGDIEYKNAHVQKMLKQDSDDLSHAVQRFIWYQIYLHRLLLMLSIRDTIEHVPMPNKERVQKIAKKHSSWYNIDRIHMLQDLQKKLKQHVSPKLILDYLIISL